MEKTLQIVTGIVSIYLSVHYFYSYLWFQYYFSNLGLDGLAIINFEDLTLSFGLINLQIIILSSVILVGFLLFKVYKNNIEINPDFSLAKLASYFTGIKRVHIIVSVVTVLSIISIACFFYSDEILNYPAHLKWYLFLLISPFILLAIFPNYFNSIMIAFWIFTFI